MATLAPPVKQVVRRSKSLPRFAFYAHLWIGVVFTVILTAVSATGVLLNHKRGLGLMPDVPHEPTGALTSALPLAQLAEIGIRSVFPDSQPDARLIDRMDVRPRDGFVKVRLRDAASMEATVDINSGRVLHVGARGDVFLEKLHSGEIFGSQGIWLSDLGAIGLVLTLITGLWLWLAPKLERGGARDATSDAS